MENKIHYKLHKVKKQWVTIAVASVALATVLGGLSVTTSSVSADETQDKTVTQSNSGTTASLVTSPEATKEADKRTNTKEADVLTPAKETNAVETATTTNTQATAEAATTATTADVAVAAVPNKEAVVTTDAPAVTTEKAEEHTSFKQIINILFKNKQLIAYIGLLLAYNLCMQIVNGIIIYYFKYVAGKEGLFSIFSVCILAEMGGLVVFPKIVKKLGREKMFAMACTFPIIGLIIIAVAGFVAPTNPLFVILGAGILKLGSGFELGVVTVCIADVIDYNELLFGTRNESIICSTQTFLMKASQAVSGLLTGVGLAMVGYNASLPQQSTATLNGIRIIMIVIPMVFADPADYDKIDQMDELEIENLREQIKSREVVIKDKDKNVTFKAKLDLSDSELEVILCGGQLRYLKHQLEEMRKEAK